MKKIIIVFAVIIQLTACTKSSIDEKKQDIPTITVVANENSNLGRLSCGTCGTVKIGFEHTVPGGPSYCLDFSNICKFIINYRSITPEDDKSFYAGFENLNGRLMMVVDKSSLTAACMSTYFSNKRFTFDNSQYMSEEILRPLGLPIPYLIAAGNYPIISEDSSSFTIGL